MGEDEEFNLFIYEEEPPVGIWFRTDEHQDLIDSVEHSAFLSKHLIDDERKWKWLILALHTALQGACVCALRGFDTSDTNVLSDKSRREWLSWFEESRENPDLPEPKYQRLADIKTLFQRITDPIELRHPYTFHEDKKIEADIVRLKDLRNNFTHFVPKGWSIELSGMPRIVSSVVEVIEHLAVKHPSFSHHLTEKNHRQIKQSLDDIRNNIAQWARQHGIQDGSRPSPG